jgi:hypothetical protein
MENGLIVLACAAGVPFLPKLVEGAKGDIALGVGLMVLLMVVTIIYLPIVLPLLLSGVEVNSWDIAQSLFVLMLIPLGFGLLAKSHSPDSAGHWQPVMNKISSLALLLLLVVAGPHSTKTITGTTQISGGRRPKFPLIPTGKIVNQEQLLGLSSPDHVRACALPPYVPPSLSPWRSGLKARSVPGG